MLIEVSNLSKSFTVNRGLLFRRAASTIRAVDNVNIDIRKGETLGCVGGSGSGKSTLGRLIMRLLEPDCGEVRYGGQTLTGLSQESMRAFRQKMQIVFQDPLQSLNPRRTIAESIERPMLNFGASRRVARERVEELLELVGLDPTQSYRYPHEYSGGQCQRIAIARALALNPDFLFLDEPVSALDVSIQAQILNLLKELQRKLGLTYLFVSHDLKIVKQFCDRTIVMYRGRVLESGLSEQVYRQPKHPFTRDFLGTVLHVRKDNRWEAAAERAEDLEDVSKNINSGEDACVYAGSCSECFEACRRTAPALIEFENQHKVACFLFQPELRTS
jgi:peptide/nickel transport system ATP-binding protein/oligopeptide transport system ATP-binding protein